MSKSLHDAIMEMHDDIDGIREVLGEVIVEEVAKKTFVDTGDLRDSWFWDEDEGLFSSEDSEKVLANEYGTVHMTGSAAVRRTMRELPKLIKKAKRRLR